MYRIQTKGYDSKEKTTISQKYILPKIRQEIKFRDDEVTIEDNVIKYIIEKYTQSEDGMRNLKRCLEVIHTKLNLCRLMKPGENLFAKDIPLEAEFPFTVTNEVVAKLIKPIEDRLTVSAKMMYL
jgi:ATP-dependent Lon protease